MKFLPYILKHLRRNWLRTGSTVLAIGICIFLFCVLQAVIAAIQYGLNSANASRIVTRHNVSVVFFLPRTYRQRIAAVPGVRRVAIENWFGGVYKDPKNFFANFAVEPDPFFAMYPEYGIPADEYGQFVRDRRGCVIGPGLARKFGWKIGDTIQMSSNIPPLQKDSPFEFVVRGIYRIDDKKYPGTSADVFFFQYEYLWEGTAGRAGAGVFVIEVDDPARAGAIARTIDGLFENSDNPTKTETESAFLAGFLALAGNLTLLLDIIGLAVTFTILLVTANTMSMAVRERAPEIAVLKTVGFGSAAVLLLVLGEAAVIGVLGGGIGLLLASPALDMLGRLPFLGDVLRGFPYFGMTLRVVALGFLLALAVGLLAGIVPAVVAYRSRITDALRAV